MYVHRYACVLDDSIQVEAAFFELRGSSSSRDLICRAGPQVMTFTSEFWLVRQCVTLLVFPS